MGFIKVDVEARERIGGPLLCVRGDVGVCAYIVGLRHLQGASMKILRNLRPKDLLPPTCDVEFAREGEALKVIDRGGKLSLMATVEFPLSRMTFATARSSRPVIATAKTSCEYQAPGLIARVYVDIDAQQATDQPLLEEFCATEGPLWLLAVLEAELYYIERIGLKTRLCDLWRAHGVEITPAMQSLVSEASQ
jgi:hypothetical protein